MSGIRLEHRSSGRGVVERAFRGEGSAGIVWSPEVAFGPTPLVLLGSTAPAPAVDGRVPRAEQLARTFGFHAAVVADAADAPMPAAWESRREERRADRWRAAIDALQLLPGVDEDRLVGLRGMGADAATALRVAASDTRVGAATIGAVAATPSLLALAGVVRVPVQVLLPWDDPDLDRTAGLAVFEAIASADKSLRVHLGTRHALPADETDETAWFLARHLLAPAPAPAR